MALSMLRPGGEPVPGYRLRQRLGSGSYGEVWEAVSGSGFAVALKLVPRGRLSEYQEEATSLELLKEVRHPNLIAVFNAWHTEDFLAIAMELADGSLWDCFEKAKRTGEPGIPREPLLGYVEEAARGIDYLNEFRRRGDSPRPVGIQHRDIKPQNLLLMGGGVKVADFGLATLLERSVTNRSIVGTIPYAAPEIFQRQVARSSDQYSLAVSYCQLRGGRLPCGDDVYQIVQGHAHGTPPDLGMLPAEERPPVARALSRDPKGRWPNCRTFAEALRATRPAAAPAASTPSPTAATPAPHATPSRSSPPLPSAGRLRPAWWLLAVLPVLLPVAGLGFWARNRTVAPVGPPVSPLVAAPPRPAAVPPVAPSVPTARPAVERKGQLHVAPLGEVAVTAGDSARFRVRVQRLDFQGPVRLTLAEPPAGVTVAGPTVIAAGQEGIDLTVTATDAAVPGPRALRLTAAAGEARDEVVLTLLVRKAPRLTLEKTGPVTVQVGAGTRFPVSVARDGFDGDVLLQFEGAPAGVVVNGGKGGLIPAGQRQATVDLTAGDTAAPGPLSLKVVATSGKLRDSAALDVTVRKAPSVAVSLAPKAVELRAGESGQFVVSVARDGFEGDVGIQFEGAPAGLLLRPATIPHQADSANVDLTAAADAPAGDAAVRVVASAGKVSGSATLKVTVKPLSLPTVVRRPPLLGPSVPHTYAVLVGIGDYADPAIRPRPHAEDDARALYDLFTSKDRLAGEVAHVRLLLGKEDRGRPSERATRANILRALEWLRAEAGPDDLVVLAYLGEGGPLGDRGDRRCYFAADSTFRGRDKDGLAAAAVGEVLDGVRSQHFCTFLDVNFKGFTTQEPVPEPDLYANFFKEFLGDDGTEDHAALPGRAVFLATGGLTQAPDLDRHDAFVQVLLDGLGGKADAEGDEPDGVVTVDELMAYLGKALPRDSSHLVLGGRDNHFVLTRNPAVADRVEARLRKLEERAAGKKLNADLAAEGRALLGRMPKLESQRSLRQAYADLVDDKLDLEKFVARRDQLLAERKLGRPAAEAFARTVLAATEQVKSKYVKEVNQGDLVAWAVHGLYRQLDEKVPEEVEDRLAKARKLDESELTGLLADVRERLGKREDLDSHKAVDIALQRMLNRLDPYTTYIEPGQAERVEDGAQGHFTGIGIEIRKDAASDLLQVVTPIKGSPAWKAGLQAGDLIATITRRTDGAGKPLQVAEVTSTRGLTLDEAVQKILGPPDTQVELTVRRAGADKPLVFAINRGPVEVETVLGARRRPDADWDHLIDRQNKIAYVRITGMAASTVRDLKEVVRKLSQEGVRGLVLDLRFNPGDSFDGAVEIADLFVDDGLIVTVRPRVGNEQPYHGHHAGSYLEFPMACLVNGTSAGGSEVVAACLQDHNRATIVGERTFGKGSVQEVSKFEGGELKLTVATFWRPVGKNLNRSSTKGTEDEDWGVRPDIQVKLSPRERDDLFDHLRNAAIILPPGKAPREKAAFKDVQLEKALERLRGQVKAAGKVPPKDR